MPTLPKAQTAAIVAPDLGRQLSPYPTPNAYGAGIGEALHQGANELLAAKENDETRSALVGTAQVRAKYAKLLDDAQLKGGDTDKLKLDMNDELSKIGENFSTGQGTSALDYHIATTNQMFDSQANQIAVTRAANDARLQGMQFLNAQSDTLGSNPAYLPHALADADALVSTFKLPPDKAAIAKQDLKNQLNAAAAMAVARIDAPDALKRLEAGEWDLTAEQRHLAIGQAKSTIREMRVDQEYQRTLKMQDIQDRNFSASNVEVANIMHGRPTNITDNPDLTPPTKETLIRFMDWRNQELKGRPIKSDPIVMRNLWLAINAPDDDKRKIYTSDPIFKAVEAQAAGKPGINTQDANTLMAMVANQKDENNKSIGAKLSAQMQIVGRAISASPEFIMQPALVAAIQMDYAGRVQDKIDEYRKTGKGNPNDLFNSASKDFVGTREFIQASIDSVKASERAAAVGRKMGAEPVMFPDGKLRVWNQTGAQTDMKNWTVVQGVSQPAAPAPSEYESYVHKAPRGSWYVEAPNNRSPLKNMNVKRSYPTKAEAVKAIEDFYNGR